MAAPFVAGAGAGLAASIAQRKILPESLQQRLFLRPEDVQAHPVLATASQFIPSLAVLKPGIPRTVPQARIALASGGIQAGMEAGFEKMRGEKLSPARIGTSFVGGLALNKPTRLGEKFFPTPQGESRLDVSRLPDATPTPSASRAVGTFDPTLSRVIYQPSNDVPALLSGAANEQPAFAGFLNQITEQIPGAKLQNVRVKSPEKVALKIKISSGRTAETVSDYLGGRIVVNSVEDIPSVVRMIEDSNRRVGPNENMFVFDKFGYRGYHAQVGLPNGMSAEVQIHVPEIASILDEVHVLYDPSKHGNVEPAARLALEQRMRAILDTAWDKYRARVGPTNVVQGQPVQTETVAASSEIANTALTRTIANGGATISLKGESPTSGYVVSPYKAREVQVPKALVTPEVAQRYLTGNQDLLGQANHFFGVWDDGNVVYLDVSISHPEQQSALAIGQQHNQEAIWDVVNQREIYTTFGESRRAAKAAGRPLPLRSEEGVLGAVPPADEPGYPAAPAAAVSNAPLGRAGPGGVTPPLQEPRLTVPATEDIIASAQRLINRDPADPIVTEEVPRLFRRIGAALRQGRISSDDIPSLREAGMANEEAADLFEQAGTFSGQTLNRLSQIARQIEVVAPELAKELQAKSQVPPTVWNRLANAPRRIVNLWRASLVSQLATAVRNFTVFHQRYAFMLIEDAVNGAYETAVSKTSTPRLAFGPLLEDLSAYGRALHPRNQQRVLNLIAQVDPLLKERLWQTPVSDVAVTGRYAKLIGTFNNAQEYFSRTIVADAVLAGESRRGRSALTPAIARKAVDRALDMTFAKYPRSRFGREFIKAWNNPILNVLTYPFPRYLTNSVRAIWEYSPAGAMRLIGPEYRAILRSGDPRAAVEVATKAALGSAMFAAASWIRNSANAGEKWYEVRSGDKTIDVRPYGPLLPVYLFIAQAVKDPSQFELRDWLEGMLGINRMAGTTLFLTSVLAGKNPDTLKRKLAEFSGQFAGGFTVPLRTFQDFVAQFSKEEATIRETRLSPLTAPAQANVPFLSRSLPAKRVLTRGGTIQREQPALRQATGLTVRTKSPLEHELDRLGIAPFELEPRLGELSIERAIIGRIGPVAERNLNRIVQSPAYQQMDEEQKADLIRKWFSLARKGAKESTIAQEPETVARPYQQKFRRGTPDQRRKLSESLKRKGLLRGRVPQALLQ